MRVIVFVMHLERYLETLFSHPRKLKGANS
jgi:hypothetical protein